jgi:uncharacterized protein with HEPN domain
MAGLVLGEVTGLTFESFKNSWRLRRAVEHSLLIISEAAKSLPPETKEAAGIAWRKIETLGNFFALNIVTLMLS